MPRVAGLVTAPGGGRRKKVALLPQSVAEPPVVCPPSACHHQPGTATSYGSLTSPISRGDDCIMASRAAWVKTRRVHSFLSVHISGNLKTHAARSGCGSPSSFAAWYRDLPDIMLFADEYKLGLGRLGAKLSRHDSCRVRPSRSTVRAVPKNKGVEVRNHCAPVGSWSTAFSARVFPRGGAGAATWAGAWLRSPPCRRCSAR